MPRHRSEAIRAAVLRLRNGIATASLDRAVPLFVLLAALAVPSVFAGPPPNAADRIDGICSALHGDVVMDGLAAFARNNGLTRDELSAAMVEAIERRDKRARDPIRKMETSWLGTFGGTNALPTLRRMALDPNDACGRHAIGAYYQLAGRTPETLSWAEAFLLDLENDAGERRKQFLGVFRHALGWDGLPAPERAALGRCLLRATAAADDSPAWTDQVLCRAFPAYAGSAERRARLEEALARLPPPAPASERKDATPDGTEFVRRDITNALATAVATNPAPFSLPVLRSPPAPRVLPATFVLPEIPQEWRE